MGAQAEIPEADGAARAEFPLLRLQGGQVDTVTRYRGREFLRDGQNVGPVLWAGEHYGAVNPQIRDLPDVRREWALFGPDGTPRGRVVTPPRIEVLEVRSGRMVALHRDERGVETVRVYPVERRRRGPPISTIGPPGVEPGLPAPKAGVLPLDQGPSIG